MTLKISTYRKTILARVQRLLETQQKEMPSIGNWNTDVCNIFSKFIGKGKLLRGSLFLMMIEAYGKTIDDDAINIASATELFHSSLLIHDDIMDNDKTRRGQLTIHEHYKNRGELESFNDPQMYGKSMGICIGDIGIFVASHILLDSSPKKSGNIADLFFRIMKEVGFAQMQDVYFGYTKKIIVQKEIEQMYLYKTARYTCSLPMMMAALYTNRDNELSTLELLGEYMGLIFQLKDDELGLFGEQKVIGKPEGSDIRENKKTLYRILLYERVTKAEKKLLDSIFGRDDLTSSDIEFVRELVLKHKVRDTIDERVSEYQKKTEKYISQLHISRQFKAMLTDLLLFVSERNR